MSSAFERKLDFNMYQQRRLAAELDYDAFYELDEAFHSMICEHGASARIWKIVHGAKGQLDTHSSLGFSPSPTISNRSGGTWRDRRWSENERSRGGRQSDESPSGPGVRNDPNLTCSEEGLFRRRLTSRIWKSTHWRSPESVGQRRLSASRSNAQSTCRPKGKIVAGQSWREATFTLAVDGAPSGKVFVQIIGRKSVPKMRLTRTIAISPWHCHRNHFCWSLLTSAPRA